LKKSAFSLVWFFLIAAFLIIIPQSNFSVAQSGTNVDGIILQDTTWTQAGNPYSLTGNVLVNNGATLTIQAGTVVNFGNYYIQVNGTLQAIGSIVSPINFNNGQITFTQYSTNWTQTAGTGCIISNSILNSTSVGMGNSANISNDTVISAGVFAGPQGSKLVAPLIFNNTFYNSTAGVSYGSGFGSTQVSIINNTFVGGGVDIGQVAPQGDMGAAIVNNTISGALIGVFLEHSGSQIVSGNLIVNCDTGIEMIQNNIAGRPIVQNNSIVNNNFGINFYNSIGTPTILQNNIYNNTNYNILLSGNQPYSTNENCSSNYWGTTDRTAIGQSIKDYNKDFSLGLVTFEPFLISPSIGTPTGISASAGSGGSIAPSGVIRLNVGNTMTFSITPNAGYHIADVLVNGSSIGSVNSYTVQYLNGISAVSAVFAPNTTPTPNPTPSPTPNPTTAPTQNPSVAPTSQPTSNPTAQPTTNPTPTPTVPEFTTIILLPLMLALFSVVLILRFRKTIKL
jgi:hypothetical protein